MGIQIDFVLCTRRCHDAELGTRGREPWVCIASRRKYRVEVLNHDAICMCI